MEKRIARNRRLTEEEAERYQRIRQQVAAELPEIRRRAGRPNRESCSSTC